jgi:CBS domain-containing protein
MEQPRSEDVAAVERLVETGDFDALEKHLRPLHPADIADILEAMDPSKQAAVLKLLDNEQAAEVLTEIDEHSGQALLFLLSDGDVVSLLEEMPSDDAVDMMSSLPPERTVRVEALLSAENREQLHELMEFEEDTAGGIMELERIAVREDATIRDAIDLARAGAEEIENLQKIYVVREDDVLTGHIDVLDLLIYPRSTPIKDAAKKRCGAGRAVHRGVDYEPLRGPPARVVRPCVLRAPHRGHRRLDRDPGGCSGGARAGTGADHRAADGPARGQGADGGFPERDDLGSDTVCGRIFLAAGR